MVALLLMAVAPCLNAQKKEIAQARSYIKSGKDYDKAEQLMTALLKDTVHRRDMKVRRVLADAVRKQYEQMNEKLYLEQKYDTAALFTLTRRMFLAYEGLDSIDAMPGKNGKSKPKYRRRNAEYVNALRHNLFSGGVYFIRKQQYATGLEFMESYIDCGRQPLLAGTGSGGLEEQAAYWALFCGYKMGDASIVFRHAEAAMGDSARLARTYRYIADTYRRQNDTEHYVSMLRRGFGKFKKERYFCTRLLDYYNSAGKTDSSMHVVEEALRASPGDTLLLFAKSSILLNTGDYSGCVAICDTLIEWDDTLADAHYNAGVAYLNMAFRVEHHQEMSRETLAQARVYYRAALPYMERYRALRPKEKDKWAAALYNIYLRLNMGEKFEEIDRLLR